MNNGPGLYIHIPFCKKKCDYCDFVSFPMDNSGADDYLSSLRSELGVWISSGGAACDASTLSFATIYIGGGTPTILTDDELMRLGAMIRTGAACDASTLSDIEFSIECNPGTLSASKLNILKQIGINRISIGCQSFDDDELKTLGRIHSSKEIFDSFKMARDAGFDNINLDLIFALPGQTLDSWKKTLNAAISLDPEHISAYNLQIEEGTPFNSKYGDCRDIVEAPHACLPKGTATPLPDDDIEYSMYAETISRLTSRGYIHYEISNFAKPGFECLHNINYWKNGDYFGAGLNAASHLNGKRYQNTKDLKTYLADPSGSRTEEERTSKDEIAETMFMGLRLLKGLDLKEFEHRFNNSIDTLYGKQIGELISRGLIHVNKEQICLTNKGIFLANQVFEKFV